MTMWEEMMMEVAPRGRKSLQAVVKERLGAWEDDAPAQDAWLHEIDMRMKAFGKEDEEVWCRIKEREDLENHSESMVLATAGLSLRYATIQEVSFKYAPGFSDAYVRAIERENQGSEDQDMEIKSMALSGATRVIESCPLKYTREMPQKLTKWIVENLLCKVDDETSSLRQNPSALSKLLLQAFEFLNVLFQACEEEERETKELFPEILEGLLRILPSEWVDMTDDIVKVELVNLLNLIVEGVIPAKKKAIHVLGLPKVISRDDDEIDVSEHNCSTFDTLSFKICEKEILLGSKRLVKWMNARTLAHVPCASLLPLYLHMIVTHVGDHESFQKLVHDVMSALLDAVCDYPLEDVQHFEEVSFYISAVTELCMRLEYQVSSMLEFKKIFCILDSVIPHAQKHLRQLERASPEYLQAKEYCATIRCSVAECIQVLLFVFKDEVVELIDPFFNGTIKTLAAPTILADLTYAVSYSQDQDIKIRLNERVCCYLDQTLQQLHRYPKKMKLEILDTISRVAWLLRNSSNCNLVGLMRSTLREIGSDSTRLDEGTVCQGFETLGLLFVAILHQVDRNESAGEVLKASLDWICSSIVPVDGKSMLAARAFAAMEVLLFLLKDGNVFAYMKQMGLGHQFSKIRAHISHEISTMIVEEDDYLDEELLDVMKQVDTKLVSLTESNCP